MPTYDLLLRNGTVWTPAGPVETSVGVRDGRIAAIGASAGTPARRSIAPGSPCCPA